MSMGGGGGGGGSQYQTNTTETILPDWVASQVQQNIGTANNLASQPYTPYTGPTLAGLTPDQLAAFQAVRDTQGVATGDINQAYQKAANLPAATQSLLNPYMDKVGGDVQSNMLRASSAATSDLAGNAAFSGAFGGNRDAVENATIASETQRNIGQAMNAVASQGWNTSTSTAMNQAQAMGQLAQQQQTAALTGANALAQVGAQQQTLTQAQYANALSQWQQAQNYPYQQLAILQSALAGSPYGTSVTSSQPYNTNPAAAALGMAASAIPIIKGLPQATQQFQQSFSNLFS